MSEFCFHLISWEQIDGFWWSFLYSVLWLSHEIFPNFSTELCPLIDVKISIFLNIFRNNFFLCIDIWSTTVMILSFQTDMPGQTVQTQIRSILIRVYAVCNSVCMVWTHYSMVEPHSSNFRVITTNLLGVRIFRKFTVIHIILPCFSTELWPLIDFRITFMLNILWNSWWIWSNLVDTLIFFIPKHAQQQK